MDDVNTGYERLAELQVQLPPFFLNNEVFSLFLLIRYTATKIQSFSFHTNLFQRFKAINFVCFSNPHPKK